MFIEKSDNKYDFYSVEFIDKKNLEEYVTISNNNKELLPSVININNTKLLTEILKTPLLIARNFGPREFMEKIFNIYEIIEKIHLNNPDIRVMFPSLSRIHDDGRVQFLQFNDIDVKNRERLQKYTLMASLQKNIINKVFPNFAKKINIDNFYNYSIKKLKDFMEPLFLASYEERKISPHVAVMDIDVVKECRFDRLDFFRCNFVSKSIKLQRDDQLYHLFNDINENETRCYPAFQNNMKFISGNAVKTFI